MYFYFTGVHLQDLTFLFARADKEVVELCKYTFECLRNGPSATQFETLAQQFSALNSQSVQKTIEAMLFLLIDANTANVVDLHIKSLQKETHFRAEVLEILVQYVTCKSTFVEGSINSANLRAFHLVNLEWRLEKVLATRSSLRQNKIIIAIKFNLHAESKNENRDLLLLEKRESVLSEDWRNKRNMLVQTDVSSLLHIVQSLEDMIEEAKSRRTRIIARAVC